jgi:hypothetical protein
MVETFLAKSTIEVKTPTRPTPEGPSKMARTFVLIIPRRITNIEDPPMMADDLRTWP